jgi:WD repeat-containing protein 76
MLLQTSVPHIILQKEIAEREAQEAEEQLLAEEAARTAKRPRHQDLDFEALAENYTDSDELPALRTSLSQVLEKPHPRAIGNRNAFVFDDDEKEDTALADLKEKMKKLKVVSRAKVTQDRIYSGAYHPETTKDLIFFGDKHGQLGIWDAQAPPGEDDEDPRPLHEREGGKYWRLQTHWPATSKSSISSIKFDPIDSHSVRPLPFLATI